jgi:hypothetical protein
MGVDFFPCDHCGESICDCGSYYYCNDDCGRRWCDKRCAEGDGYKNEDYEDTDDPDLKTCRFCRNEDVEDSPLLEYVLKHFSLSKEDAKKMYLASLKPKPKKKK